MKTKGVPAEWVKRRRNLPHWQFGGATYFVTFRSSRGVLPNRALRTLLTVIAEEHGKRCFVHLALAMPDHCHMLLTPLPDHEGTYFELGSILKSIKGSSARAINLDLKRSGSVWQKESYDRVIRNSDEFRHTWRYIWLNPVRWGLVENEEDYSLVFFSVDEGWWL